MPNYIYLSKVRGLHNDLMRCDNIGTRLIRCRDVAAATAATSSRCGVRKRGLELRKHVLRVANDT
jgi:hypothetical protein